MHVCVYVCICVCFGMGVGRGMGVGGESDSPVVFREIGSFIFSQYYVGWSRELALEVMQFNDS